MNDNLHPIKSNDDLVKVIGPDIKIIEEAIESGDEEKMKTVHIKMDGKYSTYVPNLGKSMYGYSATDGFAYEYIGKEGLLHNLRIIKGRLEGYVYNFQVTQNSKLNQAINVNVPVTNSNDINISLSFKDARQQIEEMPGLNESETEELKTKIDELEKINSEKISKKKKWEKVKPIISFVLDKGADVAITIMGLILQMKLGI
ncbi:hypothetical protein H5S40_01765 [Limosilactobacillus sp. RRLNB_1_1]|uniref:Uncharacterized protein n=1 Tax=Limosilactobacillus albertensis TaxID=2759752 RepID=A0A7W3TQ85_9LACO|nr:hypothetical protein [Limosilactobacillus albertensis]MBB1068900.1 hypothetical protein [Limosilactobacillus albertensis]MCD7118660.1 hypothetical protein [Limosilactobacillus albertensis]MCD7128191.1 hypothetical protein [Limosilactobacillus albertensis]